MRRQYYGFVVELDGACFRHAVLATSLARAREHLRRDGLSDLTCRGAKFIGVLHSIPLGEEFLWLAHRAR
jgi:hypothetical protein